MCLGIIDLARYLQGGDTAVTARALLEAFERDGFAYVEGYQAIVPQELVDRVLAYNKQFFELPLTKKEALAFKSSAENRGYLAFGQEQASMSKASAVIDRERQAQPDQKETLDIGKEDHPVFTNYWPAESVLPGFKATMIQFFDLMHQLHIKIMSLIAVALDLGPHFFDKDTNERAHNLRLLHYPPSSRHKGHENRLGAHTDFGTITLLFQDQTGGLQIQKRDGTWVDVVPKAESCVVNVADLLERWSNGRLKSTIHRAVVPPLKIGEDPEALTRDRASVAYFCNPDPDTVVSCIPGLGEPKWPSIKAGDYLEQSIRNETSI